MQDRELYEKLLGLKEPWSVENVTLDLPSATVTVALSHPKGAKFPCPVCGLERPIYDHQKRRWRHLDTCGFTTILEAEVPRIQCSEHGVKQVKVPWGELKWAHLSRPCRELFKVDPMPFHAAIFCSPTENLRA